MREVHIVRKRHPIRAMLVFAKRLFLVACILIAGFTVVGYTAGWVTFRHDSRQARATVEIQTGEVQESVHQAVEKTKELVGKAGAKLQEVTATDGNS